MKHLSRSERDEIEILINKKYSIKKIAKVLWRAFESIRSEIKINSTKWRYIAKEAEHKSYVRRLFCKKQLKKIRVNDDMEEYIRKKLKEDRSPEIIAFVRNWLHKKWIQISGPTIRKYIYSRFWYWLSEHLYSHRNHRKRKYRKWKREIIKNRIFIDLRPKIIGKLKEFWHFEWDLIVWPQGTKECLVVLIEKLSRKKWAIKAPNKKPGEIIEILKQYVKKLRIKSITFDNWIEFARHWELEIPTYFCYPHHPREKPQVERWNRDIRRYFPKWTNFAKISQNEIDIVLEKINNRPMKCLGYNTSNEVFEKLFSQPTVLTL